MNMTRIYINSVNFLKRKGKKNWLFVLFTLNSSHHVVYPILCGMILNYLFHQKYERSKYLHNNNEKPSSPRLIKIEYLTFLYNNHIECPKLEILLATKRKVHFFQKASKLFGLILHCFTSSLPKNGLENLRQRLNGQRQAKSNPRLVTCFTLKDQWLLLINSLVLFGFNAHVKINVIENVTRVNNNTEILKFIMLNITGESNASPAVREF